MNAAVKKIVSEGSIALVFKSGWLLSGPVPRRIESTLLRTHNKTLTKPELRIFGN